MIGLSVVYVEYMKDIFSSALTLEPDTRKELDNAFIDVPYNAIILDLSGIKSMSCDFAKEYISIKNESNKAVNEVNLPPELRLIMDKASECDP